VGTHRRLEVVLEPLLQLRADRVSLRLALTALGFLALAAGGRALVELATAGLREDPGLLDLLVETAKRGLEGLTLADDHFRQRSLVTPPSIRKEAGPGAGQANDSRGRRR